MDCAAYQAPPSMGFSMQEYWSGLPLPSPYHWAVTLYNVGSFVGQYFDLIFTIGYVQIIKKCKSQCDRSFSFR